MAKYSDASFWKPYVEIGGGERNWAPSGVGNSVADSKTIDEEITVIFCSRPAVKAWMEASNVAARMRSFSASRSYAYWWK